MPGYPPAMQGGAQKRRPSFKAAAGSLVNAARFTGGIAPGQQYPREGGGNVDEGDGGGMATTKDWTSSMVYECHVCGVRMNSKAQLTQHESGNKHRAQVAATQGLARMSTVDDDEEEADEEPPGINAVLQSNGRA